MRQKKKSPLVRASLQVDAKVVYGMVLLATFDKLLSTPAELYAVTAKYQVPELNPVTT
jgi:hypothetical protein